MDAAATLSYNPAVPDLAAILQRRFGLERLHHWQREAIDELLDGSGRVLVVAPTGGGKSLCYQLPAEALGGTTVVVSPLIALMADQVAALERCGIAATYLASTLSLDELRARAQALRQGRYRLVYVAPERLASEVEVALLARLRPPLVAVDEAHCISQWGHDFRPDYLRLDRVIAALRPPRVLACTATATPAVRDEILEHLGLADQPTAVVLRGFARPNLHLGVLELDRVDARRKAALGVLRQALGSPREPVGAAIIYAGTRKHAERMGALVAEQGWRAATYHAGLDAAVRDRVSHDFSLRNLEVVVATNAFGMGIDRPDIRAVVHLQAPGSIEQYYQEVGRAGRDGQPAHGLLLAGSSDFGLRRRLIESPRQDGSGEAPSSERIQWQWQMFLDLMRYAEAGSCRHDFILRHFGDEQETLGGCGHCDVCERLERSGGEGPSQDPEEVSRIVRQALSGVARSRGRAGLGAVVEMLRGVDNPRLRRFGMTSLSTHGLLSAHRADWIMALMRRLITAGLVDLSPDPFPVPRLTRRGWATMKGERELRVLLPPEDVGKRPRSVRKPVRPEADPVPAHIVDPELYEQLRSARLAEARRLGVPAYVVCHNRTLAEIAAHRPTTIAEMSAIHGMGPARLASYGAIFLEVVRGGAA